MSLRYARLTFVLLLVALLPTAVNSYFASSVPVSSPVGDAVPADLAGFSSTPTTRRDASITRSFAAIDWFERRYSRTDGAEITVLVVRSLDMKRLYHHPELAVHSAEDYRPARVVTYDTPSGRTDVHILEGEQEGLLAYALLYGDDTVARPLWFQLRVAPELLVRGRRPLTLAMARDRAYRHDDRAPVSGETTVISLLQAVVEQLRAAT